MCSLWATTSRVAAAVVNVEDELELLARPSIPPANNNVPTFGHGRRRRLFFSHHLHPLLQTEEVGEEVEVKTRKEGAYCVLYV
jgi:hypothetical protein